MLSLLPTASCSTTSPPAAGRPLSPGRSPGVLQASLQKKEQFLYLGNLDARRDWGFTPEYVECMWRMLQQDEPDDFVIGTGETHSVREYLEAAFSYADLAIENHVRIDPRYFRPTEVEELIADPRKAEAKLGWKPQVKFSELVKIMVDADLRAAGLAAPGEGDDILARYFPERWWKTD